MIYVGKVKWFGTMNWDYVRNDDYGFIQFLDEEQDIFFHRTGIDSESSFLERDRSGDMVLFEKTISNKTNKEMAVNVKLFSEANEEEQQKIYQNYKNCKVVQEALLQFHPSFFKNESLIFFLPYLKQIGIAQFFVKKCKEEPLEKVKEELKEELMHENVKSLLVTILPELYFNDNPNSFFPELFRNESTYRDSVRKRYCKELFSKSCESCKFSISILKALVEWNFEKSHLFPHHTILWELENTIFEKINWEDESYEDIANLVLKLKRENFSVQKILLNKPELIVKSVKVCEQLSPADLTQIDLKSLLKSEKELNFFLTHVSSYCKTYFIERVPVKELLQILWLHEDLIPMIKDELMQELVAEIDWKNIEESYMKQYEPLLSYIEADVHQTTAVKIAESMRKQDAAFSVEWWKIFTDSVKIRIIIYSTNFLLERQKWFLSLQTIYPYEEGQQNKLIMAVLKYFVNSYIPNETDGKRQSNFLTAHEFLMNYINECFTQNLNVTNGLNTLLDKCHQGYNPYIKYFCDARINRANNNIFCPEGKARPANRRKKQGRQPCAYYKDINLTKTKYKTTKDYKDQYFMDLILNVGFIPDLSSIYISEVMEYPFRISAYVNRLIDIRMHTKCSKCNKPFFPQFEYAKSRTAKLAVNTYHCPEVSLEEVHKEVQSPVHDSHIYLNFCYHCEKVIDSRECKIKDGGKYSQWLCMRCGGTQRIEPGTKCPFCGNTDKNLLENSGVHNIICKKCNYDSRDFRSIFENPLVW